jgi:hypothetical protein
MKNLMMIKMMSLQLAKKMMKRKRKMSDKLLKEAELHFRLKARKKKV